MGSSKLTGLTLLLLLALPAHAYAAEGRPPVSVSSLVIGAAALVLSVVLLVVVLALRHVAEGSMVADNISYVVLGAMCLAAAVLVRWIGRFVDFDLSSEQVSIGGDALVMLSTALFAIYFYRVRASLLGFMRHATDLKAQMLAEGNGADAAEEGDVA